MLRLQYSDASGIPLAASSQVLVIGDRGFCPLRRLRHEAPAICGCSQWIECVHEYEAVEGYRLIRVVTPMAGSLRSWSFDSEVDHVHTIPCQSVELLFQHRWCLSCAPQK